MSLYAPTMTLCILIMIMDTFVCSYNDSVYHQMTICVFLKDMLHSLWFCLSFTMWALTVTFCDIHNDSLSPSEQVWSFAIACTPSVGSQNYCLSFTMILCVITRTLYDAHNYSICSHNDIVCSHNDCCAFMMTLGLHNDVIWTHNDFVSHSHDFWVVRMIL